VTCADIGFSWSAEAPRHPAGFKGNPCGAPAEPPKENNPVLKKTVLAAAITAAALLAVSPLAFASSHPGHVKNNADETSAGLVTVADNNLNAPIQACNNDVPVNGGAAAAHTSPPPADEP
jgi:hypothetical protein